MAKKPYEPDFTLFCDWLAACKTGLDVRKLLVHLLSPSQITRLTRRFQVSQLLDADMTNREIVESLGCSKMLVSEVARARRKGETYSGH